MTKNKLNCIYVDKLLNFEPGGAGVLRNLFYEKFYAPPLDSDLNKIFSKKKLTKKRF